MSRESKSKDWMRRHVNDAYVKRAQTDGYRARSAYKLIEIAERDRLFQGTKVVVDLGCTPGGWSQVAATRVGPTGIVVAVDRLEMQPLAGVKFILGDFSAVNTSLRIDEALEGRRVDLVLCDISPNISGVAVSDQARSIGLAEEALEFSVGRLKPGGNFLVKAFHGAGFDEFVRAMRTHFGRVASRKPAASRSESREVYLLGLNLRAAAGGPDRASDAVRQ
jgi:23S rRNA (uridine2552-2'-O)-methyltransferase